MKIKVFGAQKKLAIIWILSVFSLLIIILAMTVGGKFSGTVNQLWGWFLQNTIPILTLIIGTLVIDARSDLEMVVDKFYLNTALALTIIYLILIFLTLVLVPAAEKHGGFVPIEFINFSNVYLGPFQGLVTAALGIFFIKRENES